MEGLGYWGLTYCGTSSLHGKLLTGNGKGGIKAHEYIKYEGGGKEIPAIQPIIESTNLASCYITSNGNLGARLTWGCKFLQIPATQATAKQDKFAKTRQSTSDLKLLPICCS